MWAQFHFRGLEPDDTKKWEQKKISLAELLKGHNMHCDLRMKLGDKFVQWVLTEDSIDGYMNALKGKRDPKTGNVNKALCLVKPSAEEPRGLKKEDKIKEALLDMESAKRVSELALLKESFIIRAGDVGATAYKDAWMQAICLGRVKAGLQRDDVHEYFFYPEKCKDKEILNGRYIIRCFKVGGGNNRWWFWKCSDNPLPIDPIEHKAQKNSYYPIPAKKVKKFGRESYR